jgi:hypothetical protein
MLPKFKGKQRQAAGKVSQAAQILEGQTTGMSLEFFLEEIR